jgi:hypothetical protein
MLARVEQPVPSSVSDAAILEPTMSGLRRQRHLTYANSELLLIDQPLGNQGTRRYLELRHLAEHMDFKDLDFWARFGRAHELEAGV